MQSVNELSHARSPSQRRSPSFEREPLRERETREDAPSMDRAERDLGMEEYVGDELSDVGAPQMGAHIDRTNHSWPLDADHLKDIAQGLSAFIFN